MTAGECLAPLAERYLAVRSETEDLAEPLSPEDQTVQSMPDVSPTKWHRAHTTWFFETFLLADARKYRRYDERYPYLFNSYYEQVGPRYPRPRRGVVSRPGAAQVGEYRAHVDRAMEDLLHGELDPAVAGLVELGIHHEQQHQELLLMDIKHVLSCNPLAPAYLPADRPAGVGGPSHPGLRWIEHPGGTVTIGARGGFSFDNELPRHEALLPPFALASRPVTCGEWMAFMADDGYRRPELWLSDGWALVQGEGWEAPLYWSADGDGWQVFTLHGLRPVDPAEPVCHVSYHEADAFAHWTGARLPSEAEWEALAGEEPAAGGRPGSGAAPRPGADAAPPGPPSALHPRPVGIEAPLQGDVWQWTSSSYGPYPGFRAAPGAVGEYNGKFMVNQYVLRGGCCATPAGHLRVSYRNFFPASARWPFTGLRLARDL